MTRGNVAATSPAAGEPSAKGATVYVYPSAGRPAPPKAEPKPKPKKKGKKKP